MMCGVRRVLSLCGLNGGGAAVTRTWRVGVALAWVWGAWSVTRGAGRGQVTLSADAMFADPLNRPHYYSVAEGQELRVRIQVTQLESPVSRRGKGV